MYKIVNYNNKPAAVVSSNPYCNIVTIAMVEKIDGTNRLSLKTIYDKTTLEEYNCPYANGTQTLKYCSSGKCKFEALNIESLSLMCSECLISNNNIDKE